MAALLARNAKVDARASRGETPLLLAARRGHAAAASELAARGANVSAVDADGHDALLLAAVAKEEGNGAATIRALAQISSEVLAAVRTPYGKARGGATVLHVACQMAHGDAVTKALIELGAAINARDEKGFSESGGAATSCLARLRGPPRPARLGAWLQRHRGPPAFGRNIAAAQTGAAR